MNKTGLVYHPRYLEHEAGTYHPEGPERLEAVVEYIQQAGVMEKTVPIEPVACSLEDLLRVHSKKHVEYVKKLSASGGGWIDPDTYCSKKTFEIALLAAGGEVQAGKAVAEGKVDNAFALVRPPGHHASRDRAKGFCIFNNVAVMIRYLQKHHGIRKVCVFDWDVHAADGTIELFYSDPSVFTVSIHQDPMTIYPGTGFLDEVGEDAGKGYNLNVPVPLGSGDADYRFLMEEFILERIRSYEPDFMVISAGFDSHIGDPIGSLALTEKGYSWMAQELMEVAKECCGGRLVVELEGGYNLTAISESIREVVEVLLGEKEKIEIKGKPSHEVEALLSRLRKRF